MHTTDDIMQLRGLLVYKGQLIHSFISVSFKSMDDPTTPTTTSALVKVSMQGQQLHALQKEGVTYLFSREVAKVFSLDEVSPSTLRRARDATASRETLRVPADVLCILKSKGVVRENATYTNMHPQRQVEELLTILRQRRHIPPWPPAPAPATASSSSSPASTSCMDVLGEQNKEEERAEKRGEGEVQETSTPERNGDDNVSPESNGDDDVSPADLPTTPPQKKKRRLLQFAGTASSSSPASTSCMDVLGEQNKEEERAEKRGEGEVQETSTPERNGDDNVSPESNGDDDVSPAGLPTPPPQKKKRRLLQYAGKVDGMVDFLRWLTRPKVLGGLELQHSTEEKTKEKLLGESHTHTHTHTLTLTYMYIHVPTHFFLFRLQFTSVSSIVSLTVLRLWLMPLTSRCSGNLQFT